MHLDTSIRRRIAEDHQLGVLSRRASLDDNAARRERSPALAQAHEIDAGWKGANLREAYDMAPLPQTPQVAHDDPRPARSMSSMRT